MGRLICVIVMLLMAPGAARAQDSGLREGAQALVRGDYALAARILRPLADDPANPNSLAQFFMALLYNSGHGVGGDELEACGRYLLAAKPDNPLLNQSLALARNFQDHWPSDVVVMCASIAADDYRGLSETSVVLAPGHTVTVGRMGAIITYEGNEHRVPMNMGGRGWVFLPVQHTALDVSHPATTRRHFLQIFSWQPSTTFLDQSWSLAWTLIEIVGSGLFVATANSNVASVAGQQPPASFPLEDIVRVRVGEGGEAEWDIVDAVAPLRGIIPLRAVR
jgi:hypothetical protein